MQVYEDKQQHIDKIIDCLYKYQWNQSTNYKNYKYKTPMNSGTSVYIADIDSIDRDNDPIIFLIDLEKPTTIKIKIHSNDLNENQLHKIRDIYLKKYL